MKNTKLSVIIVAYRDINDVKECLKSISKYEGDNDEIEIIVVDNSEDLVVYDYVKTNFPFAIVVDAHENNGFGAGNNKGVKYSNGEYLLFLNPDTELITPIFKQAIQYFENNKEIGYWGIYQLTINNKRGPSLFLLDKSGIFYSCLEKLFNKFGIFINGLSFVSGACFFIRKNLFIKAGMFDENIFMYHEESDLIHRMNMNNPGTKGAFNKRLKIIHKEGKNVASVEQYKRILDRWYESELYYCEKYGLNVKGRIASRLRYEKLKLWILSILKFNQYDHQRDVVLHYIKLMKSL